jgi:hypothetical protein
MISILIAFLKIVKIEFKNGHMLFFLQDDVIACKKKNLILFTSLINNNWIKAFFENIDLVHNKRNYLKKLEDFLFFFVGAGCPHFYA